jgi:hypothetical protein
MNLSKLPSFRPEFSMPQPGGIMQGEFESMVLSMERTLMNAFAFRLKWSLELLSRLQKVILIYFSS